MTLDLRRDVDTDMLSPGQMVISPIKIMQPKFGIDDMSNLDVLPISKKGGLNRMLS